MLLLLLIVSALLLLLIRSVGQLLLLERRQRQQLLCVAPNVSRVPLIGALWQMRDFQPDNLHVKFAEYVRLYGRSFVATVCGRIMLVTADPSLVNALLLSQQQLRKSIVYGALSSWLGNGLLLSRGAAWHTMRKLITPTFHFSILEQYIEVFDRQCNVLIEQLQQRQQQDDNCQQSLNIYPYMCLATLDIIVEAAMGVSINAQQDMDSPVVQAVKDVTNILATRFMRPHLLPPLLFRLCWRSGYQKQRAGIRRLHNFTEQLINRRRQLLQQQQQLEEPLTLNRRTALLDTLLQARVEGVALTDSQIRDEVSTFIFEGHDTTTSAASCCLYLLSRHAAVQQRLFQELQAHFGDNMQRAVVYADFAALNYLHCVVKESLRLYPPIPAVGRCLEKDLPLANGAQVPAGSNVIVLLWQLLRDEQVYQQPMRFWPERHLDTETSYSYLPFSAGPRNCIGQRFALYELKTIVIKMLRHFELLPLGAELQPSIKIVLRSSTGVNLGLKARIYK